MPDTTQYARGWNDGYHERIPEYTESREYNLGNMAGQRRRAWEDGPGEHTLFHRTRR